MMFGDKELAKLAKLLGLNVAAALADLREHKLNAKRVGKTLGALNEANGLVVSCDFGRM